MCSILPVREVQFASAGQGARQRACIAQWHAYLDPNEEGCGQGKEGCVELMQSPVFAVAILGIARLRKMNSNLLTTIQEQDRVPEACERNADHFSELCRARDLLIRDLEQRTRNADIAMRESIGAASVQRGRPQAPADARGEMEGRRDGRGGPAGHVRDNNGLAADLQGQIERPTSEASSRPESPSLEERGSFSRRKSPARSSGAVGFRRPEKGGGA
ncbi:hypothetical protein DL769_007779 [Monosporascus sp. CRB-8-3]|nr:hypothetical protein DL769_007779 [Monosporascus sp. CRB-8-3]